MRKRSTSERTHAIVVGGGIAGLLAARVLVEHFESVTLIERDHYPQGPVFRSGTPQARQLHSMLLKGQRALEELFPNLKRQLLAHGALERDYGSNESLYYYGDQRCPVVPPILRGWNASRMLLEWQIRQEMVTYEHLRLLEGHLVTGLLINANTVTGVQFRARNHSPNNPVQSLQADLVIDTSGSSSHIRQWLKEWGYDIKETITHTGISYSTQFYQSSTRYDWKGITITTQNAHTNRRSGMLMTIEKGQWMIVLAGTHEDSPPIEQREFLTFAQSLPNQSLYEAMKAAKPISPIYGYRRIENRLRHCERLKIENLIIMGDALCTLNPIYGHGITVSVLEAQALDSCLRKSKGQKGLAHTFQKKAAHLLRVPWMSVTSANTKSKGLLHWYMERLTASLPNDPALFLTTLEVWHMVRPPSALFHPKILLKVLMQQLRQQKR